MNKALITIAILLSSVFANAQTRITIQREEWVNDTTWIEYKTYGAVSCDGYSTTTPCIKIDSVARITTGQQGSFIKRVAPMYQKPPIYKSINGHGDILIMSNGCVFLYGEIINPQNKTR